jgi:hypothetical protein
MTLNHNSCPPDTIHPPPDTIHPPPDTIHPPPDTACPFSDLACLAPDIVHHPQDPPSGDVPTVPLAEAWQCDGIAIG